MSFVSQASTRHPRSWSQLVGQKAVVISLRRIDRSRRLVLAVPWIGFAWQCLLAQSSEDLICALLAASGAFLVFFDVFRPERFYRYSLSILVVLGFAVTLQIGPLFFTATEGHSITFNLVNPVATFGHGFISSLLCLMAHSIYRQDPLLQEARQAVQRLLFRLQLFQPLRSGEVIAMGALGIIALAFSAWFPGLAEESTVLFKFIQGFQFFSVIPVAFLLRSLSSHGVGPEPKPSRIPLVLFLLSIALIVLVSIGRNARSPVVIPVACLFIGLALQWLYGLIRLRLRYVFAFVLVIVLILPLATDLATAIVMVRGQRDNVSASQLFNLTLAQFQDLGAIQRYRIATSELGLTADWSENYVNNLFLARFTNAKYPDNSLANASRLSPPEREEMAAFQWWRLLATLPSPLLTLLGAPDATKKEITSFSYGDKLYHLASGSHYALGGFRTGHFFGTGMAGFGFNYLLILLAGLLLVFPLVDAHALLASSSFLVSPLISMVAITQFISWFSFSNAESVVTLLAFPLRGFIEPVLLFALARWFLARI